MARSIAEIFLELKDRASAGLGRVGQTVNRLGNQIFSVRTALQGLVAAVSVRGLFNMVKAFAAQEDAVIKLNAALAATGRFSVEGSQAIQAMAKEMQHLTTVGDEAAIAAAATVAQFTKTLSPAQIAETEKAIVGIAQVTGRDLGSVAFQVAKGLGGVGQGLKRLGIDLSGAGTEQARFNLLMAKSATFFDVAVASSQSLSAQIIQADNAWGDLRETLGQVIVVSLGLTGPQNTIRDRIEAITASITKNEGTWAKWGRVVVAAIKALAVSLFELLKIAFNVGQTIGFTLTSWFEETRVKWIAFLDSLIDLVNAHIIAPLNALPGINLAFIKAIDPRPALDLANQAADKADIAFGKVATSIESIGSAWSGVVTAIKAQPLPGSAFAITGGAGAPPSPVAPDDQIPKKLKAQETAAQTLGDELDRLVGLYQASLIPADEFVRRLEAARAWLLLLTETGAASEDELLRLHTAMGKINEALAEMGRAPEGPEGIGPDFWARVGDSLSQATESARAFDQVVAGIVLRFGDDFGNAISTAFEAVVSGSQNAGTAFKGAMLQAIAAVAEGLGRLFIANAVASVAAIFGPVPNPGAAAAAARWTAAATLMFALAGSIKGAAGGAHAGGAAGATARGGAVAGAAEQGTITIVMPAGKSIINLSDPDQVDQLVHVMETIGNRRVTVRYGG